MYHLLNVLQQKKFFKSEDISHAPHQIRFIWHIAQNVANKVLDQLKIENLDFVIINHT